MTSSARLIAALAVLVFLLAGVYLVLELTNIQGATPTLVGTDVGGFDSAGFDAASGELVQRFNNKTSNYRAEAQELRTYGLWLNFLVTTLTAGCTLLTALKAAGKTSKPTHRFVLFVALLTFVSSLASWGDARLREAREERLKSWQEVRELKNDFFATYGKETAADKRAQVIQVYDAKLADL